MRWPLFAACSLLVVAATVVYATSFSGPFIVDDIPSIQGNLRRLQDLTSPANPSR